MTWYRILLKLYRFLVSSSQDHFKSYAEDVIAALDRAASQGQIEGLARWALRNAVLVHLKRGQLKAICEALDRCHDLLRDQSISALMSVVQGGLLLKKRKGVDVEALWSKCAADLEARLDALEVQANPEPEDYYFEALTELYRRLKDHQSAERVWLKRVERLEASVTLTNQEFGPQVASGFQHRVVELYEALMSWNGRQGDYRALLREAAEYERELTRRWMGNAERIEIRGEITMEEVEQWLAHLWEGANEPWLRLLRLGCDASGFISRQELLEFGSHEENQPLSARLFGNVIVDQQGRPLRYYTPEQAALLTASRHGRMSLGLYANVCLRTAWERILSEDLASPDDLLSLYQGVGLVEAGRERVVGQGFRALFEERYEDAIHLLVPQFEASLRRLYHCVTLHGVRSNRVGEAQHMVLLNEMLEGDAALGHADFGHPECWQDYAYTWSCPGPVNWFQHQKESKLKQDSSGGWNEQERTQGQHPRSDRKGFTPDRARFRSRSDRQRGDHPSRRHREHVLSLEA